eukprot:scaffold3440_cov316-Prasinococcus_capsulatus_cf.AAC.9
MSQRKDVQVSTLRKASRVEPPPAGPHPTGVRMHVMVLDDVLDVVHHGMVVDVVLLHVMMEA